LPLRISSREQHDAKAVALAVASDLWLVLNQQIETEGGRPLGEPGGNRAALDLPLVRFVVDHAPEKDTAGANGATGSSPGGAALGGACHRGKRR
jgi:hypothetical protein